MRNGFPELLKSERSVRGEYVKRMNGNFSVAEDEYRPVTETDR